MPVPVVAFDVRPDELADFERCAVTFDCEIRVFADQLTAASLEKAPASDVVSILGNSRVDAELLGVLADRGVRYLSTRTVGFDHIDVAAANALGIKVAHVQYPPNSVAEYTVMLILMTLRQMKRIQLRCDAQDFSLAGNQGRELGASTVGVVGTGSIGAHVARLVKAFGARVLAYDPYPNDSLAEIVEYVSFDELMSTADVVTLHAPATPENTHLLNAASIAKMRPGAMIVNCARGELIDSAALIAALETGQISAAGLDVIENDLRYFHQDARLATITDRNLVLLRGFPNVVVTPHIAFYTREVVTSMVELSIESLLALRATGNHRLLVTGN